MKSFKFTAIESLVYYLKCYRFKTPTQTTTKAISAELFTSLDLSILTAPSLPLLSFNSDNPNIFENTVVKHLGTPGSDTEMIFSLRTARM